MIKGLSNFHESIDFHGDNLRGVFRSWRVRMQLLTFKLSTVPGKLFVSKFFITLIPNL